MMPMHLKKMTAGTMIAGALGLPALSLGIGVGAASADPGQPCGVMNCQGTHPGPGDQQWHPDQWRPDQGRPDQWRPDQGRPDQWRPGQWQQPAQRDWDDQRPWDQRRIDDARWDHRPFNWAGQRVEPFWDPDRAAWGFWFLGTWMPL
jgi:hypothetical protein